MNRLVDLLFGDGRSVVAGDFQIIKKKEKSDGQWVVRDRVGRREQVVASDLQWRPLVDWVRVENGRIVGRAAGGNKIPVYMV